MFAGKRHGYTEAQAAPTEAAQITSEEKLWAPPHEVSVEH